MCRVFVLVLLGWVFKAQFGRNQKSWSDLEYTATDLPICFDIITSKTCCSPSRILSLGTVLVLLTFKQMRRFFLVGFRNLHKQTQCYSAGTKKPVSTTAQCWMRVSRETVASLFLEAFKALFNHVVHDPTQITNSPVWSTSLN